MRDGLVSRQPQIASDIPGRLNDDAGLGGIGHGGLLIVDLLISSLSIFCAANQQSKINNRQFSRQRFCLGGSFLEYVRRDFFDRDAELELWHAVSAPPAIDFPMCAQELDIGCLAEVEQHRMLPAIKLLRKRF